MTRTLPSADDRSDSLRRFERRRVEAEVRARLFGGSAPAVVVDRFEVRRKLGEGAMGIAYAAWDPKLQREVAVKLLDVRTPAEAHAALQEARALARVAHESVLTVHEAGEHEGLAYIVSELVAGGTLREWLAADPRRRAPKTLLPVLVGALRGIAAAHQRGIAHRDLKPENVLVGGDGRPRVADFGLAITAAPSPSPTTSSPPGAGRGRGSPLAGTVAYMAPEQLRGERADPLSDQFAFCVMAFEALFERLPFEGATHQDLLRAIESGAIAAIPSGHPALHVLPHLRRGLALDASARWPSVDELARALARRSRKLVVGLVALAAALVAGVAAAAFWLAWDDGDQQRHVDRAIVLTQRGKFAECADYMARHAESDGAMATWVGCAEAANDSVRLDRACATWPKRTKAAAPSVCAPFLQLARAQRAAGKFRECTETIYAAPPSMAATGLLATCSASLPRDPIQARRMCKYLEGLKPPKERTADCDAGVKAIK